MSSKISVWSAAAAFALLLVIQPAFAQEMLYPGPEAADRSPATEEGYRSPLVNPAALAFGNARGITYTRPFDTGGLLEEWELFFNGRHLAYGLQQTPDGLFHSLTSSFSPLDNLYTGVTVTTIDWDFARSQYTAGLLYRPADFLSLGGRGVFRNGTDPQSAVSAALRPFAFSGMPDRLLTAGFEVGLDRLDPSSYTVSLGSSPVKWLDLNVEYDLTDGSFSAGLALSFSNLKSGAGSSFGSGASLSSGRAFASISPRPYTRPLKGAQEVLLQRYRLDGPIVNARQAAAMGGFHLLSDERTIWQVRKHLERMADDPQVDGIAFINDHPQVSLSTAMELIELLKGFKESGKRIVFYQDYMSITDYLIAAAVGDEIFLHPGGTIDVRGLAISQPYLDRFLARFGVEVENLRSHPYKSSYNFLTEPGMTEAEREAFSMLVASLQRDVTRLVREGRGDRLEISAEKAVDEGPYLVAERALEAGMVDGLIEKDRFTDELSSGGGETVTIRSRMPMDPYRSDWSDPSAEKVAVINAVGNIHTGEGRPGSSIGSETLTAAIRAARKDASVSGILLRVDSGGGSALASAMIAREIELAVTGDNGRGPVPVVVSMGSTAASGGYYISALADKIVASPATLTGSIGVIGIVPHIEELLRKQQITWEVVKESEQADLGAIYRELTDAERAKLRGAIMNTYDRFVTTVSKGRKMQEAEVDEVARGRIWSGRQAAKRGLVDELGGIETALDVLAGEMDTERPLELHDYTYRGVFALMRIGGFSANLLETLEPTPWPAELEAVPPAVRSAYLQLLRGGSLHEHVLTVMPYSFPEIHGK